MLTYVYLKVFNEKRVCTSRLTFQFNIPQTVAVKFVHCLQECSFNVNLYICVQYITFICESAAIQHSGATNRCLPIHSSSHSLCIHSDAQLERYPSNGDEICFAIWDIYMQMILSSVWKPSLSCQVI